MKKALVPLLLSILLASTAWAGPSATAAPQASRAGIPATPVLTFYQWGGRTDVPYYTIEAFARQGARAPAAGTLAQGSSIIPCLVMRDGRPLSSDYVGFELVVDARTATREATERFKKVVAERASMTVENHHCGPTVKYVVGVRNFFPLGKPPLFGPEAPAAKGRAVSREKGASPDAIVRAFHNSAQCDAVDRVLLGRRARLADAWDRFIAANRGRWPEEALTRARQLDYAMRTAIWEGHLDRGCNAYGACERDVIALSIRNRARACSRGQGCRFPDDVEGVATKISQYNIWDEFLTQITGLTSCFLRAPAAAGGAEVSGEKGARAAYYAKVRSMYEQSAGDVERILFGDDGDLAAIFPGTPMSDLTSLRHYYHAPAMGKCFPNYPRADYVTAAAARKGGDYALIANTRIHVDEAADGGYRFRDFRVELAPTRDVVTLVDAYPGFVIDAREVSPGGGRGCVPYGVPRGCAFKEIGRWRRTPSWVRAGHPVAIHCRIRDRGESCLQQESTRPVTVGSPCDTEMRPFSGIR